MGNKAVIVLIASVVIAGVSIGVWKYSNYQESQIVHESREGDLAAAAFVGDTEKIEQLIRDGMKINATDKLGYTALTWAVIGEKAHAVELLVNAGAVVDVVGDDDLTPIFHAIRKGDWMLVRNLLEAGANVDYQSRHLLSTPLMLAAERGDMDVIETLLLFNADRKITNSEGRIALDIAKERGHHAVVDILCRK